MGVIAFQMLTGRRPFGEGASQEAVLREGLVLNARSVVFPAKPPLTLEARDFITRYVGWEIQTWHSGIDQAATGVGCLAVRLQYAGRLGPGSNGAA